MNNQTLQYILNYIDQKFDMITKHLGRETSLSLYDDTKTVTSAYFTGTLVARKYGNLIVLNFYNFQPTSTSLQRVIPYMFRPADNNTYGILTNSQGVSKVQITTVGDIIIDNCSTSEQYSGSITYII